MDKDFVQAAEACTHGSDTGTMTFPQVVNRLTAAGVERYLADLVRHEKIFYRPDGASCAIPAAPLAGTASPGFDAAAVASAIRASRAGAIGYAQFCERILTAGCVGYVVSLTGRRAVYFGRTGETHVEPFPRAA